MVSLTQPQFEHALDDGKKPSAIAMRTPRIAAAYFELTADFMPTTIQYAAGNSVVVRS